MTRNYRDIPTHDDNVRVHITYAMSGESCVLRGYAVDAQGVRIPGSKTKRRRTASEAAIPTIEEHLYAAVVSSLPCPSAHKSHSSTPVHTMMDDALTALKAINDPICNTWCTAVRDRHITYFSRRILPVLAAHTGEWLPEDRDALRQALIDQTARNGRASGIISRAEQTVDTAMMASATIYARMRDIQPDLPHIDLAPQYRGARHIQRETIKSLPRSVRRQVAAAIAHLIDDNPRLALAATVMYDCGLRTAEACAVHITDVIIHDGTDIASIAVLYQERDGYRSPLLKTDSAYRIVPMTHWGHTMLRRCLALIGPLGDDEPLCLSRDLSATMRKILMAAGLNADDFGAAEIAQHQYPDYDSNGKHRSDVCAYILRHDWASRCRNNCGLTAEEIDYLLGHRVHIPVRTRNDMRMPDYQVDISHRLERYVHDPVITIHPAYNPITACHGSDLDLIPYESYQIINRDSGPIILRLDVTAAEGTETISLTGPINSMTSHTVRVKKTNCMRSNTPVIGADGGEQT